MNTVSASGVTAAGASFSPRMWTMRSAVTPEADTVFILYDVYTIRLANEIRQKLLDSGKEAASK